MRTVDFSEAFAACDLKLIELIRYVSIECQGNFDLGPMSCTFAFLRNHLAIFNRILYVSFWVHVNVNLLI